MLRTHTELLVYAFLDIFEIILNRLELAGVWTLTLFSEVSSILSVSVSEEAYVGFEYLDITVVQSCGGPLVDFRTMIGVKRTNNLFFLVIDFLFDCSHE